MKKFQRATGLFALCAFLAGCMGPGKPVDIDINLPVATHSATQSAYGSVDPQKAICSKLTIHTYNRQVPAYLLATDKLALSYITNCNSATNASAAVDQANVGCRLYTKANRPSDLVAVIVGTTVYAMSEFPFALGGASLFNHAKILQYGGNAASEEGGGGFGNGIVSLGGKVYTFDNCGKGVFESATRAGNDFNIVILEESTY